MRMHADGVFYTKLNHKLSLVGLLTYVPKNGIGHVLWAFGGKRHRYNPIFAGAFDVIQRRVSVVCVA